MGRSVFYFISEDENMLHRVKSFAQVQGVELECYSPSEWCEKLEEPEFRSHIKSTVYEATEMLSGRAQEGATILRFPKGGASSQEGAKVSSSPIRTMDEMEKMAIEKAIQQFNGNLTEAAKALGIGRATLYRKVKLYQLDPNQARRPRAA